MEMLRIVLEPNLIKAEFIIELFTQGDSHTLTLTITRIYQNDASRNNQGLDG